MSIAKWTTPKTDARKKGLTPAQTRTETYFDSRARPQPAPPQPGTRPQRAQTRPHSPRALPPNAHTLARASPSPARTQGPNMRRPGGRPSHRTTGLAPTRLETGPRYNGFALPPPHVSQIETGGREGEGGQTQPATHRPPKSDPLTGCHKPLTRATTLPRRRALL